MRLNDPNTKAFLRLLEVYKKNPNWIQKEQLIDAFDKLSTEILWVSISDYLKQQSQNQKQALTAWNQNQPVEVKVQVDEQPWLDDHLKNLASMMLWE